MDYTVIRKALERCLRPERVLIELEEVILPDLDLLRFFLCGRHSRSRTSTSSETYRSARHYGILTNLWGETTFLRVADEFWESEELYSCSPSAENPLETAVFDNFYERRIDELLMETELPSTYDLQEQAIEERDDSSWGLLVDPDLPPRTVYVGLDALGEAELADLENHGMDYLVVYPPTGLNLELEKDLKDALDVFQVDGFLKHALEASLEFEGFPLSFWELVRGKHKFELGEEWVWRSEDGTMLGVKESFEKIVPREVDSSD
ncbi:hypothetical protein BDY24DRAFT_389129 [Mrakia frigida]|uniref:uncharacterized protein n=1 Tax=Mrakia frigida TaxID=29902 RepID=UPI003FCC1261